MSLCLKVTLSILVFVYNFGVPNGLENVSFKGPLFDEYMTLRCCKNTWIARVTMARNAWSGDNVGTELGGTINTQGASVIPSGFRVESTIPEGMAGLLDKGSAHSRLEGVIATLSAKEIVDTKLTTYKVVVFMKKGCPYCLGMKNMFRKYYRQELAENGIDFTEINRVTDASVLNYLKHLSGGCMMPMVFINGQYIGGSDETKDIHDSGQLARMLGHNTDT